MDIKIGEVIANLRREKGITQEQFANEVGVSIPAVSKWETGQSYPDITLLPAIAEFFNVSIDSLMNFSIMDINKKQGELIKQLSDYVSTCDFENGLKLAFDVAKKYPNEFVILMYTADLLNSRGSSRLSPSREQDLWDSISYYEAAIILCKDKKKVISFKEKIANIYTKLGMYDQALKVYEEIEIGYEFTINIANVKYAMRDVNGAKKLLQEKLSTEIFSFGQLCWVLRKCYKHENNNTMALETQKFLCVVWEMMTGEIPNYYDDIVASAYSLLGELYMEDKHYTEMWNALEKAVYHAVRFDKNPSYEHVDVKFTDALKERKYANTASDNRSKYLLNVLSRKFSQFSEDERYSKLINELEKVASTKKEMGIWK